MTYLKKFLAAVLAAAFMLAAIPALSKGSETTDTRLIHGNVVIDTDPAGGYTGDYVVIYNADDSLITSASTGSLRGLIETEIGASSDFAPAPESCDPAIPYIIDVDGALAEEAASLTPSGTPRSILDFYPGVEMDFYISHYNPSDQAKVTFKLLCQGEHCNVWTVTNEDYHPIDAIDETYPQAAADEFDSKFELMRDSYGDFNDTNGDGRVNLLFYNIDDGWVWGQGYVGGYFYSGDYTSQNGLPMIHIDTYPGIQYENGSGEVKTHFEDCFGTIVHEFQHCINYCETGGMATWLNESLSGSAEELCYPGSGLVSRIADWHDHSWSSQSELHYPAAEYEYNSDFGLHKGSSITAWSDAEADIYARYGEVMLFSQYLYTRYGSSEVFKKIIKANSGYSVDDSYTALTQGTGWSLDSIFRGFFTAMVANDLEDGCGFRMNQGYDPASCYGLEDVYSLLSPVVYTSESPAGIYCGGFITVKPKGGNFVPPEGASDRLNYVGISFGEISLEDMDIVPQKTLMLAGDTSELTLRKNPADANDFEIVWSSSDESVATVEGTRSGAVVTAVSTGAAAVIAEATDNKTGEKHYATAIVKVMNGEHYTRYEKTDSVTVGVPYMIGYDTGSAVYVMMNNNPNGESAYHPWYHKCDDGWYSYGIKALTDAEGNITAISNDTYPDATVAHAEWVFEKYSSEYYKIKSGYEDRYLFIYASTSSDLDLYANSYGNTTNWKYDAANHRLSYYVSSSLTKYATYAPVLEEPDWHNGFCAVKTPTNNSTINLYRKTNGAAFADEPEPLTVIFKGRDGSVLKVEVVAEGGSATAPTAPQIDGFTFTGWDGSFSNVTEDIVVTAVYEANGAVPDGYHIIFDTQYVKVTVDSIVTSIEADKLYSGEVTFTVSAEKKAVILVVDKGNGEYEPIPCNTVDGVHNFTVTVTDSDVTIVMIYRGDANLDGRLTTKDATAIKQIAVELDTFVYKNEYLQKLAADANKDNRITTKDATALKQAAVEIIDLTW